MTMNEETGTGLKPHPLAELLPLLEGEEFEALVADLKANGLLEPITTYQGLILDGRNRDRACAVAGIKPATQEFEGLGSPAAFVVAKNIHRRHLNESQRALIGAKFREEFEKEAKANMSRGGQGLADLPTVHSRDLAAQAVNVSSRLVGSAEKVLKGGVPELVEAAKQGEVAVTAAADIAELPPEEQAEVVAQGPAAVRDKAAAIRRAKKAEQPQGTSPEPQTGGGVVPVTSPPMAAAEDQLPDKKWLEGLAIRSELTSRNRAKLDREALHWRRLKALNDQALAADPGLVAEARERHDVHHMAPLLTDSFFYIRPPESWVLCAGCSDNWASPFGDACPTCHGDGFMITTFSDPFSSPESPLADAQPVVAEPEQSHDPHRPARRPKGASRRSKRKRARAAKSSTATTAKAKGEIEKDKQPKGGQAAGTSSKPAKSRNKPAGSAVGHTPAGRPGAA